jgi:hypothetical protein
MTEKHAKYSPSKLPRIVRCPGSVEAERPYTQKESPYALEGTMLHEVTEKHLLANTYNISEAIINTIAPDYDIEITNEHKESVQEVLDWVAALHLQYADNWTLSMIEEKVALGEYAAPYHCEGLRDVYGTADYLFVAENVLYVIDWKYGKGIEVYPDSEQSKAYAAGALVHPKLYNIGIRKVILVIGQPRLYSGEHFKTLETTPFEIRDWVRTRLVPALTVMTDLCPSDKACMWCLHKNKCTARAKQRTKIAAKAFEIHAELPDGNAMEDIADFLDDLPSLKKAISDIEMYANHCLKNGKEIPGWKLVHGRSIRQWKDEKAARIHYFSDEDIDPDDLVITKFKSPTQIEKLIGKRNITDEDRDLVIKPEGKPTLVKETDRRNAIEYQNAEDKFAQFVS